MSRRSIAIAQRSHILAAVLEQVASAKSAAQAESSVHGRINPLTRGRLNTLRYGAFIATLTLVLAFLGLYRQTSRNNLNALHAFVSDNRSRFRNANLNSAHTYGAYLTWREWDRENLKAITARANAKTAARRAAANA